MSMQPPASSSTSSPGQEFVVRVPKNNKKHYCVMRFHKAQNVDVTKWSQAKMERENNLKDFKAEEEMPKFGAGSEYGREFREEARRKKYGIIDKKYNPDEQPWLLRVGGKAGKKYKGIREGGISENASYYVFTQAPDGAFEAFPIEEWYNFTPIQRYKTLNAEEAEEEFGKRDKVLNYFSIMVRKRLKNEEEGEKEEEAEKVKKKKGKYGVGSGEFKISDMDDWLNSSEEEESENEDGAEKTDSKSKPNANKKKANSKKKKKKKDGSDEEDAIEDSDDGDEEGREVDYMSDGTSSSGGELPEDKPKNELKGVEDEDAIRKMEQSDSEKEEGEEEKKENPEEGKEKEEAKPKDKKEKDKKASTAATASAVTLGESSNSGSDTSDSDDFDNDTSFQSAMFMQKSSKKRESGSSKSSRANTPTKFTDSGNTSRSDSKGQKRKNSDEPASVSSKKHKLHAGAGGQHSSSSQRQSVPVSELGSDGITEEAVKRYLMRKPMTTTELLQKFKSKKTGLNNDQIVNTIAQILKRLDPEKQNIKGKLYLFIRQPS